MEIEDLSPCRNVGAPSDELVNQVVTFLNDKLLQDASYLNQNGLSINEMTRAFPAAIERIRGSRAASNQGRRDFVGLILEELRQENLIDCLEKPIYGKDTLYKIELHDGTMVGVIQKGCPDGAHSSINWERPSWADELFIWWCCSSTSMQPGEHIWKGISRLRKKIRSEAANQLDGIIFASEICNTPLRPCPKSEFAISIGELMVPPPCIYSFPKWSMTDTELNWKGTRILKFPGILLSRFGIVDTDNYFGNVGFQRKGTRIRTEVNTRFGALKTVGYRGAIDAE